VSDEEEDKQVKKKKHVKELGKSAGKAHIEEKKGKNKSPPKG